MLGCCEAVTMPTIGQHQSTKSIRAPRCLVPQCPSGRAAMPRPWGSAASKSVLPSASQPGPYVHRRSVMCGAKRSKKSRATPEQEAVPDKTEKGSEEALVGTDDAMVEDAAETTTRVPVASEAMSGESADAVAMPAPRTMTVSMPAPTAAPTTATALEQKEGAALIGLVVAAAAGVGGLIVVGKRFLGAKLPEMQKAAERKKLDRQFTQRLDSFCSMMQAQPEVNLSAKHLGEQGCAYVVEALAFNNTCSSLDLGKNMVGTGGVLPLVEALKHNDTLRVLGLDTNAIDDDGIVPLAELLVKNLSIRKLDLSANRTTNVGAAALEEVLRRNTTLEELDLSSNEIGYEGAVALAKGLTDNSALKVLKLSDNYFTGMGALPLAQALRQNQSLRELRLKGCELGDDGITAICDALADRTAPMEVLDLGNNSMSEEGAVRVAELLKKRELKQLNLYMNDFGNTGAEALAEALRGNSTLEALDIGGNNVGAKGIKQLAEVLSGNSTLQSLELSYNPIGPDGAAAVVRVIKYEMPGLQTLKLGWCKVGAEDGAKAVSDLLMYNTTLQVVDLRGNNLGDDGALQVSRGLRSHENSKLMDLDLGYNEIKDDGACALANALKNNPEVVPQDLRLNMNYIQKLGGMALTEAIDMVYEMAQREMVIHF